MYLRARRQTFSKILHMLTSYSKCTGSLTFENFFKVETADGGEALFPYQAVSAVAEFAQDSPIVASGLLFTAPAGGQYPLNSAYVMAVADPAHFPIAWREPDGSAIKVVAPNDGAFSPGPGAVLVKRVGGEEDVYAYQSLKSDPASPDTGPAGLVLTAANGTRFPRQGAFAVCVCVCVCVCYLCVCLFVCITHTHTHTHTNTHT